MPKAFNDPHTTYRGKCITIIQPEGRGTIKVKAEAEGMEKNEIVIVAK